MIDVGARRGPAALATLLPALVLLADACGGGTDASTSSPNAALGQVGDWRLRDAVAMASLADADLADPGVLDTSCTWGP